MEAFVLPATPNVTLSIVKPPVNTQYVVVLLITIASPDTGTLNSWFAEERLFIASMSVNGAPSIVTFGHPAGKVMDVALNAALFVSVAATAAVMMAFVPAPGTTPVDHFVGSPRFPLLPPIQTGSLLRMSITDFSSAESANSAPAYASPSGLLMRESTPSSNVPSPVIVRSGYAPSAGTALKDTSSEPSTVIAFATTAPIAPPEYGTLNFAPSLNTTD